MRLMMWRQLELPDEAEHDAVTAKVNAIAAAYDLGATPKQGTEDLYPVADTWTTGGALPHALYPVGAAPLQDGRVLFSPGGLVYDPSTGTTTSVPLTPGEEVHGWEFVQTALTPLLSGLVLRTGGSDDDRVLREAVLHHPATNTGSSAGTMPVPRHLHTATKSSSWTFAQDLLIISLAPRECIVSSRARWPDEARRNVP
ncbi:hypothetical protein WME73_49800 [Sorangium sp. So ce302]|uniref:hypothetical protein n=1 Tax=Sorangium sp. So ce302 TaxID=3133297 RepID=UPI003F641764